MDTQSFYTRQMLVQYGKQLVAARRLARYEQMIGRGHIRDEEAVAEKRRITVERVAREIVDNLIFSGSENSIVQEVRDRLGKEVGHELVFRYPPAEQGFLIFKKTAEGELEELPPEEKHAVMKNLWDIALTTVDETML